MTYALRGACLLASIALPAQTARWIVREALIALEFRRLSFHDPFHVTSWPPCRAGPRSVRARPLYSQPLRTLGQSSRAGGNCPGPALGSALQPDHPLSVCALRRKTRSYDPTRSDRRARRPDHHRPRTRLSRARLSGRRQSCQRRSNFGLWHSFRESVRCVGHGVDVLCDHVRCAILMLLACCRTWRTCS
jgi:hypothetical protein